MWGPVTEPVNKYLASYTFLSTFNWAAFRSTAPVSSQSGNGATCPHRLMRQTAHTFRSWFGRLSFCNTSAQSRWQCRHVTSWDRFNREHNPFEFYVGCLSIRLSFDLRHECSVCVAVAPYVLKRTRISTNVPDDAYEDIGETVLLGPGR